MNRYPIKVELLSETIWGNGESKNGIVNTDVLVDDDGFPYLLGKTFKGCLKKSVRDILSPFYKDENIIQEIFEKNKRANKDKFKEEETNSTIRFTNFYLDDSIKSIFKKDLERDKDIALETLTDIRFSINIQDEKLRAVRVLKKGLIFRGYIETTKELTGKQYNFIKRAVKSLKHMGINKSRGKGLVKVEIGEVEKDKDKKIITCDKNFDYILYELDLKEPVKVGSSQSQYDYEESKGYISGASIRGAVLKEYLTLFNIESTKANLDSNFSEILKKACFYDSYPIFFEEGKKYYSFPTPNIFRISKDTDKDALKVYKRGEHYSTVFKKQKVEMMVGSEKKIERRVVKLKKGDFSYYKGEALHQFSIKKEYKFHHTQEKTKENIFRYEAIAKGQKFYGVIDVSKINEKLKKLLYTIMEKNSKLYLGGARTAGYGKTIISSVEIINNFNELSNKLIYLKPVYKESIDIYFLSDAILRGDSHEVVSAFNENYIKEKLGVDYTNEKMDISPVILTGFNSKFKSALPQVYGIEKGSIIRYEGCQGLDNNKINEFIKTQHGDRNQDGLGRVIINPKFLDCSSIKKVDYNFKELKEEFPKVSSSSSNIVEAVSKYLNDIKIDKDIKSYIADLFYKKTENSFQNLSNSRINNTIATINKCLLKESPLIEFKKELNKLKVVTQNLDRNRANKTLLESKVFGEYTMEDLINLDSKKIHDYIEKSVFKEKQIHCCYEVILLKLIRGVFYFSLKDSRRGEANG